MRKVCFTIIILGMLFLGFASSPLYAANNEGNTASSTEAGPVKQANPPTCPYCDAELKDGKCPNICEKCKLSHRAKDGNCPYCKYEGLKDENETLKNSSQAAQSANDNRIKELEDENSRIKKEAKELKSFLNAKEL